MREICINLYEPTDQRVRCCLIYVIPFYVIPTHLNGDYCRLHYHLLDYSYPDISFYWILNFLSLRLFIILYVKSCINYTFYKLFMICESSTVHKRKKGDVRNDIMQCRFFFFSYKYDNENQNSLQIQTHETFCRLVTHICNNREKLGYTILTLYKTIKFCI